MFMIATILRVDRQSLLVRNEATGEQFVVFFSNPGMFSVGERVQITYDGRTTLSIPPQITASSIQRIGSVMPAPPTTPSTPAQMRATVLQVGQGFLIVRNAQGQQMRVDYPNAHHFCVRQQIIVWYDTITLSNPPRVTATDIAPVC